MCVCTYVRMYILIACMCSSNIIHYWYVIGEEEEEEEEYSTDEEDESARQKPRGLVRVAIIPLANVYTFILGGLSYITKSKVYSEDTVLHFEIKM